MTNNCNVLIIEDDKYIQNFISLSLKTNGYSYLTATSGRQGLNMFCLHHPDLIILDPGLPDVDGIEIITTIRKCSNTPIIVVSAIDEEQDKIIALDAGANDYMTKPFHMGELLARIRVTQRKLTAEQPQKPKEVLFNCDDLTVDFDKHLVLLDHNQIHLTPIEFKLLELLITHKGKVLTHNYIIKEVWGYVENTESTSIRVYMANLRRKIEKNPGKPKFILTEIGVGYRFVADL